MLLTSTLLAIVATVTAHGTVNRIDVEGGQSFSGPLIGSNDNSGPIWHVSTSSPVTDLQSNSMFCGVDAIPGQQSPNIGAGSTLTIHWGQGYADSGDQWPHNTGPIMTYMAKCNGDCSNADSASSNFFKISELGIENGEWVQAQLKNGQPYSVQIPNDVQPGNYLIRTEIVALHSGVESYPSCSQFTVTGDGSNSYASATAKFPGAYLASDPGLQIAGGSVYNIQSSVEYQFPGPAPVTGVHLGVPVGRNGGSKKFAAQQPSSDSSHSSYSSDSQSFSQQSQQNESKSQSQSNGPDSESGNSGCNNQYEQCLQAYVPGSGDFDCQTQFVSCQQQSLGRRWSTIQRPTKRSKSLKRTQQRNARMMYRTVHL
ncbi:hypothetical protein E3P92_01898 [Wallemia ichthyophaga]|uniref:lytic cellulose monooxygenase (C4-dehydrogenating) n=1 Tax=Wallemia ichthyophaga (strain EXF-994 / CBS 113033) TaxID=1299270 RepID=R9AKS8_WALI9|nr:Endoglucanase-7 [Wallemia ichthyophaga EXF-994]EOR02787.1 Endoglucanase-7 [Wallemia ichthyophaga EXF-994]TIB14484.1 hypothetical protein E3P92_01898 [Wallemia ichthyophaga]TIB34519.1 hypothetical protein E3P84_01797 [Wallemia ichthyophaga]TIB41706.1 hypothetical protein E3P83_01677 [Wallemia ichthyophaga]